MDRKGQPHTSRQREVQAPGPRSLLAKGFLPAAAWLAYFSRDSSPMTLPDWWPERGLGSGRLRARLGRGPYRI